MEEWSQLQGGAHLSAAHRGGRQRAAALRKCSSPHEVLLLSHQRRGDISTNAALRELLIDCGIGTDAGESAISFFVLICECCFRVLFPFLPPLF